MKRFLLRLTAGVTLALAVLAALWFWPVAPRHAPPPQLPSDLSRLDRLEIDKSDRLLSGYVGARKVLEMPIALGFAPEGDKRQEGDGRTPEGRFHVDRRNGQSAYHLSLGLDYPRPEDRARAAAEGVDPGGDIFIHGQPNALPDALMLTHDWTAGCIAVSNAEIALLWDLVPLGTPVDIRP